jgi:hypothetical protein
MAHPSLGRLAESAGTRSSCCRTTSPAEGGSPAGNQGSGVRLPGGASHNGKLKRPAVVRAMVPPPSTGRSFQRVERDRVTGDVPRAKSPVHPT